MVEGARRLIRVAYVAGEPNPSRVPHLRVLAAVDDIDLTVVYAAATVHRRTWTVDPGEAIVLRGPRLPTTRVLHHDYPLTPQLWRLLDRGRFDCVIVGGWSLMATQLAIVWARTHRVPYLLISENHLREPRPAWVRGLKSIVLRHVVPQAAGHLVTGTLAREHQLAYGARPDRIVIWPNTVDVAGLARRVDELRGERGQEVTVLHVGRLIREKAPDELLAAFARACERAATPLRLVLVGDGPLEPALRERARGLPVEFRGLLEGDALVQAYADADIFALFSRRETWGIVVNEAAAAGLPLVLTDRVGAAADLLVPGENGELVRSGEVDAQARALAELADDPALRGRYGARSRELVSPFTYEASVEELARLIRAVVGA
ncbi:MAG TPA: glycosyltransferase family 4 protein [Gaiellaceae bacterium]|nr:glycosyltransferase family 4 protein [Gaiellaceae bacterium]